jgi:hypothetical protein
LVLFVFLLDALERLDDLGGLVEGDLRRAVVGGRNLKCLKMDHDSVSKYYYLCKVPMAVAAAAVQLSYDSSLQKTEKRRRFIVESIEFTFQFTLPVWSRSAEEEVVAGFQT